MVKTENSDVTKENILEYLEDKIVKWWMPDDVVFTDKLPHTATGKIQKNVLRKNYENFKFNT